MNRVRELREEKGLSQEGLARLADVSTGTIRAVEKGQFPQFRTARAIARILEVTTDELFPEEVSA
ncbi:MAG: helix-turn-helix transcriptional regulator [Actinomycetota bacterium]